MSEKLSQSKHIVVLLSLLYTLPSAWAHPVSFEGAISLMGYTNSGMRDYQTFYSWTPFFASGVRQLRFDRENESREFTLLQANTLLKRWNNPGSQGNLYLSAGAGNEKNRKNAILFSGDADWESRKLYTSAQFQTLQFSNGPVIQTEKVRAGFAPYVGEFTDIHSWFILEAARSPWIDRRIAVTPIIRLFYRNVLLEFGRSFRGDFNFNFMVHY